MKKNRFAFLFKYILLAVLLCAVISFTVVFARYSTSASTDATVSVSGFVVSFELYAVDEDGGETLVDDGVLGGYRFEEGNESYSFKVKVTNDSEFAVRCEIEPNEYYVVECPSGGGSVTGNVLISNPIESKSEGEISFSILLAADAYPDDVKTHSLKFTVSCCQASA